MARSWMAEQSLKHRDLAHRMNARGTPVDYIAAYIDVDQDTVRRWLAMPRPIQMPRMDSDDSWMVRGVCNTVDPELWFPERGCSASAAIQICRECPVQQRCLEWALAHNEQEGVWGGVPARDRQRMRKNAMDRQRNRRRAA
jgi:WhiB family redox-sensing transcriptional regulator